MIIDLINNINNIINSIPHNFINLLDFDFTLYNNIKNNKNIINNKLNIFDFFDIVNFITKILNTINNIPQEEYKIILNTAFLELKNELKEYSPKINDELLLFFKNCNYNEVFIFFDILDYIDTKHKYQLLEILNEKIYEVKHNYLILKINYNYDNYFNELLKNKDKNISLTSKIIKKYNFINNNDFDIKKIKIDKNMSYIISKNDFYSIINNSINAHLLDIYKNLHPKKNISYIKSDDIINTKSLEAFLYNYKYFYQDIKTFSIDTKYKNKILVNKSIFQIV